MTDTPNSRAAGITELLDGCPLPVIHMLAGHATFLMMANADERALDGATWEDMAATGALDAMRGLFVANSDEVFERYKDSRDSWQHMDYGVCLAGGTLCDSGGEVLVKNKRDGHEYAPVKGGKRNCTSCRFFAAPDHAPGGLIARLNATSLKVSIAGERLRDAEKLRRDTIAKAQSTAERTPMQIRAAQRRLETVEATLEEAFEEVKLVSSIWTSTFALVQRWEALISRALMQKKRESAEADGSASTDKVTLVSSIWTSTFALVQRWGALIWRALMQKKRESAGSDGSASTDKMSMLAVGSPADVTFALNQCTEFDLTTRICEDYDFYRSADATDASLRRAVRLDRVLAAAGRDAVFATLSTGDLVTVGNAYARWLRTKLGEADMAAVVEGRKTLVQAGVLDESDRLLAQCRSTATAPALAGPEDAQRLLPEAI